MNISGLLTYLRERRGLTKTDAAKKLGVSTGAYANWEYGNRKPDYPMLQKIADFYEVPISFFYEDKEAITLDKINYIIENDSGVDEYHLEEIYDLFTDVLDHVLLPIDYPSEAVTRSLLNFLTILFWTRNNTLETAAELTDVISNILKAGISGEEPITEDEYQKYKEKMNRLLDDWWDKQKK